MVNIPDKLFWTIKEAAKILEVPAYVLRYWEDEFIFIKPKRTEAGHRRYKKEDIELLLSIKELLYNKGLTIEGAKKHLKNKEKRTDLSEIKNELKKILEILG
jgi:DNA-binding transcriptional MerR regulator